MFGEPFFCTEQDLPLAVPACLNYKSERAAIEKSAHFQMKAA